MRAFPLVLTAFGLVPSVVGAAPAGVERWSATSSTATAITGDIILSPTRFVAAGNTLLLAVDSDVTAFGTDQGSRPARILRVTRPADPRMLNGNHLCGAPVRWIVAYRSGGGAMLNLAVFSGAAKPTGESAADLCGTFLYSK